ncbi:MAG: lytic transglycosylase domain-containing protein [Pelovirga sp.]
MSINPLNSHALFAPGSLPASASGMNNHPPGNEFAALLEQATQGQTGAPATAEQALIQLKVTQLQMMQGLFSDSDDDEQEGQPLFDMSTKSPFSLLDNRMSQFIDKYRRNVAPLQEQSEAVGRDQIEGIIDRVARKVKLAPELIRAVVAVESSYNPTAVSPVGAQGLMQLMPATAADLGVKDSFDPAENIDGGSRYLGQLLNKYAGDLDRTLAAYNWGQGNVDRHGLEKMPPETRNYLAKVKQLLQSSTSA